MAEIVIALSTEEAQELYRYMQNSYLDPNKWSHLTKLLTRIDAGLQLSERRVLEVSR